MDHPERILIVIGKMDFGGIETLLMNLYRSMDHSKIQFDFLLNYEEPGAYDEEIRSLGGKLFLTPRLKIKNVLKYPKAINQFFKEHSEYKIVHGHLTSVGAIYLTIAKKHGVKTTIIHSHATSVQKSLKGKLERILMLPLRFCADYYFACSDMAGVYAYGKNILKKSNYKMLKNGIEFEKFKFNEAKRKQKRKELGLDDFFVLGNVGRFKKQKNHRYLIRIFQKVFEKNQKARLLLVGDGELFDQINDQIKKLGLEKAVIILSKRTDVNELLMAMDVLVLPSQYEGLPVIGVEAQASGLICIFADTITQQTDFTGLIEFLPLKKSPEYWAEQILKYQNGYKRQNTKMYFEKSGFTIESQAKWLQGFYLSLLNGGSL